MSYYSLKNLSEEITTASGDVVSQIPSLAGYATESYVTSQGYVTSTEVSDSYIDSGEMTTISGDLVAQMGSSTDVVVGSGSFTADTGTEITHNLGNYLHSTVVVPAGVGDFNAASIAEIGNIYVKLGENVDQVYITGDTDANGLPFNWFAKLL